MDLFFVYKNVFNNYFYFQHHLLECIMNPVLVHGNDDCYGEIIHSMNIWFKAQKKNSVCVYD